MKNYVASMAICMTLIVPFDTLANVTTSGVSFGASKAMKGTVLRLKGTGVIRYLGIFKVSVAGFYLPEGVSAGQALSDVPRSLELAYLHAIQKEDFAESTRVWIRKNTSVDAYKRLLPQIERFNSFYEDVQPGDRYTLSYDPALGTTLFLNGEARGTVQGADFSAALFSIWIGDTPLSEGLRSGLLGLS
jgi:hypothetical protein